MAATSMPYLRITALHPSPLRSRAIAKSPGLGRLAEGNRDVPRSVEVLRTDPEMARQWQTLGTLSFTAHDDLASTPVDIVELKRANFAHSHAKTDQHW
jgi:hypothetical protein